MAGWRSEIRDGDWLVLRPAAGVGFGAVEGEVVVLARGDAEARTFHVKRVVRGDDGRWWLRSDNSGVGAVEMGEGDVVVGVVVRVLAAEEVANG
jgi:SOS-response transcriptional repressor LexA